MDAAYDANQIWEQSKELGHVPIIDSNPRTTERKQELAAENKARATIHMKTAEAVRYNERSTVERVNGRLKDEFGGRHLRVRGHARRTTGPVDCTRHGKCSEDTRFVSETPRGNPKKG